MAKLSAGKAWEDTAAFLRGNGKLVFPVALAFIALPQIVASPWLAPLSTPQPTPEQAAAALPPLLLVILFGLFGSLAIYALVLRPGMSVAESLRHAIRRLLPALAVAFILGLLGVALLIPATLAGGGAAASGQAVPPAVALLSLLLLPVAIFLVLRFTLAQVAVADHAGPLDALKRSWALTRGNALRLFGIFVLVVVTGIVLLLAVQFVLGTVLLLVGTALGGQALGLLLATILSSIAAALVTAVVLVLVATIYRQLEGAATGA